MGTPIIQTTVFDPLARPDTYSVSAGGTFVVTSDAALASGLLANDSETPFSPAGIFKSDTYSIRSAGITDSSQSPVPGGVITSDYGTWALNADGSFSYSADGLASKLLTAGATASDVLYYQTTNLFGFAGIGEVTMTVMGQYDPPELSFEQAIVRVYDEASWQQQYSNSSFMMQMAPIHVLFAEPTTSLAISTSFNLSANNPEMYSLFASQLQNLRQKIDISYSYVTDSTGSSYIPSVTISDADVDFLRPGDFVQVSFVSTIFDGPAHSTGLSATLVINGSNSPPLTVADEASLMQGNIIARENSVNVLLNDSDPDPQTVLSVQASPEGTLMQGNYGQLTLYPDGSYQYVPSEDYRYWLTPLHETFFYTVQDQWGGSALSSLAINLNPDPASVVIASWQPMSFHLGEDLAMLDGSTSAHQDGIFTVSPLGQFVASHLVEQVSGWEFQWQGFLSSNPVDAHQVTSPFLVNLTSALLFPVVSDVQTTASPDGTHTSVVSYELKSFNDFQFLNQDEQLMLTYLALPTDQGLKIYPGYPTFRIIIHGENDAPLAEADTNLVYAGQSVDDFGLNSTGGLLDNDYDVDSVDHIHVGSIQSEFETFLLAPDSPGVEVRGIYGTLFLTPDGHYTYQADQQAALAIPPESEDVPPTYEIFAYTVEDEHGSFMHQLFRIQVRGPQDKPMAVGDQELVELADYVAGSPLMNILSNDLDADPSRLVVATTSSLPDYLSVSANGNVSIDASALTSLKAGEALDLSFTYQSTNGFGQSNEAEVQITVIGANSAPQAHDDQYFYQNIEGSVFSVSATDGVIYRVDVDDEMSDSDSDGDDLSVTAIAASEDGQWLELSDGSASLQIAGGVVLTMHSDGSFVMNSPDAYRGEVSFVYRVSDGIASDEATVTIDVGGPMALGGQLLINEISLNNGIVTRNAYTDNGDAPNRITVGVASIELLNKSAEAVTAADLQHTVLEIVGPDGVVRSIALGELTGFTQDAHGNPLNKLFIPAGGVLMIYEPGRLGWGTWSLYGPDRTFVSGGSGSYEGEDWHLGGSTRDAIAVNLAEDGSSIDFFAANGADTSQMTGIIGIGDSAQGEGDDAGVPWAGTDVGTGAKEQYDALLASQSDTIFGRISFTDTNSERDWSHYVFSARTIGDTNTKLVDDDPTHIANPEDESENLNPGQDTAMGTGQTKQMGSGTLDGSAGYDVLVGQSGNDDLSGGALDDVLEGGGGDDSLDGGTGGDVLLGGAGKDSMTGGSGDDLFVYNSATDSSASMMDIILDFKPGEDKIDLSRIDADPTTAGDQAFGWGGLLSSALVGKITYSQLGDKLLVKASLSGADSAVLTLLIDSQTSLTAADFVL